MVISAVPHTIALPLPFPGTALPAGACGFLLCSNRRKQFSLMLCALETNSGDISEVPSGGSHSQDLLGEAKSSSSSVGSSSETHEVSLGWQVCIGCFALGKSLCLPNKGFMEIQHAGHWKLAWKNTKKKLRELTGTFLGFTNLLPTKGN